MVPRFDPNDVDRIGSLKQGDLYLLASRVTEWRRKTLVLTHELYNGEHLAVRGQEIRAWAEQHPDDPARLRTVPIPAEIKQRFDNDFDNDNADDT